MGNGVKKKSFKKNPAKKKPEALQQQLSYDPQCGLWRASVSLALQDMKNTQRDLSLVDWEVANEFI